MHYSYWMICFLTDYGWQGFVLPFKVAEVELRITNEILSQKIKNMITDGGASYDFACQLRDLWENLMKGEANFDELGRNKGLSEKLEEALAQNDGKSGFLNIDQIAHLCDLGSRHCRAI